MVNKRQQCIKTSIFLFYSENFKHQLTASGGKATLDAKQRKTR